MTPHAVSANALKTESPNVDTRMKVFFVMSFNEAMDVPRGGGGTLAIFQLISSARLLKTQAKTRRLTIPFQWL